jgi:hypothetical protein
MNLLLTPNDYDKAEVNAAATIPNRIMECCQPVGFMNEGYPTHVKTVSAVGRYVDVMQEGRLYGTFNQYLGGKVTSEEMDLMRKVANAVLRLTTEVYGKPKIPKDALTRALNVLRQVRHLYPEGGATVLEIGGGSGYVAALLCLAGYRVVTTDIAQAFYLFQNHLMNTLMPGKVIELANDPRSFSDMDYIESGSLIHVPWWKFVLPNPDFNLPVDLVTANHCLCEMHPRALAYTLKVCVVMLTKRGDQSTFLFEGWGSTTRNPIWTVHKAFAEQGFSIAHSDILATVYARKSGPLTVNGPQSPNVLAATQTVVPGHIRFLQRLALFPPHTPTEPSMEKLWHPPIWVTPSNPVSKKITDGREQLSQLAVHRIEDFEQMLRDVLGGDELTSDDEKFLNFVGASL